jgi:proline iminopeptidase
MLAEAYMGTHPRGVRSVIFSSPVVTTQQWVHDADSMIKELPDSVQRAIAKH